MLRAGGFFVHSKKPSSQGGWTGRFLYLLKHRHTHTLVSRKIRKADGWSLRIAELARSARSVCWKAVVQEDGLAVWQKPIDTDCYDAQRVSTAALCNRTAVSPDATWYTP